MSRYIDAEWLSKLFPDTGEGEWTYNVTALGYIDSAPSIDIVRCKECIYWTYDDLYDEHICGNSEWTGVGVKADDFCSRGERESDE